MDLLTLQFGLRYEEAVLDWFRSLPQDLGQLASGAVGPAKPKESGIASNK